MPICICGMHRSGTSMVARLLQLSGLYLGEPCDIMPPTESNPDGHWEHLRFVEINDQILNELGAGWDSPPHVSGPWDSPRLLLLRAKAEELLADFSGREPWGWKDPRNSLTLPFWLSLVPELSVVACLRNPLEVAVSLRNRNFSSYAHGLKTWTTYNQAILDATTSANRLVTAYDRYFPEPKSELRRVLTFAGIAVTEPQLDECCGAARTGLRHHCFDSKDLLELNVSPEVVELYLQLRRETGRPAEELLNEKMRLPKPNLAGGGQGTAGDVANGEKQLGGQAAPLPALRSASPQLDVAALDAELLRRDQKRLHEVLGERDAEVCKLQGMVQSARQDHDAAMKELAARDASIRALQAQSENARKQMESMQQQLENARQQLEGMRQELENTLQQAEHNRQQLKNTRQHLESSRQQHDAAQLALEARDEAVQSLETRLQVLRVRVDCGDREREALREQLSAQEAVSDLADEILARLSALGDGQDEGRKEYLRLVCRIRDDVRAHLPPKAEVAVVSKGDDGLLRLCGRKAWHFPGGPGKSYPGYYPGDSVAAIAQLEAMRAAGATHLLLPSFALWWCNTYPEFFAYLKRNFRLCHQDDNTCVIYAVAEHAAQSRPTGASRFAAFLEEFRDRFDREPAVLDWSDSGLASTFPRLAVMTHDSDSRRLPYLDRSIDVVVVPAGDPERLAEGRRVADLALAAVTGRDAASREFKIDWLSGAAPQRRLKPSIIIPVHNGIQHTENCLKSLCETVPREWEAEFIVVDDASNRETEDALAQWSERDRRIRVLRNAENLGFVGSVNRGAKSAAGDILVMLNNDTLLTADWLPPLLRTFTAYQDAGAVGGRLLYPDGRLQEAGGVVFCDGSAAQFGHDDYTPDAALYRALREVDYCSGALLATPRQLFEELGGLDTAYGFGYYEDTDYCFRVRAAGRHVYYQPESTIIHLEGGSCGTDLKVGLKRWQVENQVRFCQRWQAALECQPERPQAFDAAAWHRLALRGRREEMKL
jgi:GT2 family glycosyltransferase